MVNRGGCFFFVLPMTSHELHPHARCLVVKSHENDPGFSVIAPGGTLFFLTLNPGGLNG